MKTVQAISNNPVLQNKLLFGSSENTGYLWENLAIERRASPNWLDKMYKGSVFDAFWRVLSSPVG